MAEQDLSIVQELRRRGYDGMVGMDSSPDGDTDFLVYVTFDPRQIHIVK